MVAVSFSAVILHPGIDLNKVAYHYVLVIGFYLIVPNRIPFKIIPSVTISLLNIIYLVNIGSQLDALSSSNILAGITTFLVLNVIGFTVAVRIERQRFHQHLIQETLSSGREQLIAIATTDSLTGILNRRGLFEMAEIETDRYRRYQNVFSFAIIDLDNLKSINDQYGHPAGDLALQTLINCIENNMRSSDFLGRLAGDEFGLCMPGIHKQEAQKLVRRIKEKLSVITIPVINERPLQLFFSAGITEVLPEDKHFDDLCRRADQALYAAKKAGRDRVEVI